MKAETKMSDQKSRSEKDYELARQALIIGGVFSLFPAKVRYVMLWIMLITFSVVLLAAFRALYENGGLSIYLGAFGVIFGGIFKIIGIIISLPFYIITGHI